MRLAETCSRNSLADFLLNFTNEGATKGLVKYGELSCQMRRSASQVLGLPVPADVSRNHRKLRKFFKRTTPMMASTLRGCDRFVRYLIY
jgi:hypothetical protein